MVFEGLRFSSSVTSVNISSNCLRGLTSDSIGAVLAGPTPLASLDISGNFLDDKCMMVSYITNILLVGSCSYSKRTGAAANVACMRAFRSATHTASQASERMHAHVHLWGRT